MLRFRYNGGMKNGHIIEKILFLFLLFISGGVVYIVLAKGKILSSDNALLIILSSFWIILEYKTVASIVQKTYGFSKKIFHFSGKNKLRKV